MALRGHYRLADDVGQIGADGKVPINANQTQSWAGNKTATNAEKSPKHADQKSHNDQISQTDLAMGDREVHYRRKARRRRRSNPVVTASRTAAWPIISRIATIA